MEVRGKKREWERLQILSRKLEIKGTFHARMGIIKERNNKDLRGTEKIKKRWKGYLEELYKKVLMTGITTMMWSLTSSQTSWV